ncbi:MAG: AAA family ATPase [Planctomycetota bacterium]
MAQHNLPRNNSGDSAHDTVKRDHSPVEMGHDRNAPSFSGFFRGAGQIEALARLAFVQACGHAIGHMHGEPGCGKSWVLRRFAMESRREDTEVGYLDVTGCDGRETLLGIAELLSVRLTAHDARYQLWQAIGDRLREHQVMGWRTLLLFDHVDKAGSEVPSLLGRLAHAAESPGSRLTLVVATTRRDGLRECPELEDRVGLRIAVEPWTVDEIGEFVSRVPPATAWEPDAIDMLWRLSGGMPRVVRRIAELGLQAAELERLSAVSGDLLECVHGELLAGESLAADHANGGLSAIE